MDSIEDTIRKQIQEEVDRQVPILVSKKLDSMRVWQMDIADLVRATSTSKSTIENFVKRFDVKQIEEWVGSKRFYRYPEVRELWEEYSHEQYVEHYKGYSNYVEAKETGNWDLVIYGGGKR